MASINPHIHFNGNTEEAFKFYQSVLGGEFKRLLRFKELSAKGFDFPEEESNKILNISLVFGENNTITGSDVPNMLGTVNENENRSKITITADSRKEAETLFIGLSEGGTVEMPIGDGPWCAYFGAFRDKYGVEWMIESAVD